MKVIVVLLVALFILQGPAFCELSDADLNRKSDYLPGIAPELADECPTACDRVAGDSTPVDA